MATQSEGIKLVAAIARNYAEMTQGPVQRVFADGWRTQLLTIPHDLGVKGPESNLAGAPDNGRMCTRASEKLHFKISNGSPV
jgi:hypothetical protein